MNSSHETHDPHFLDADLEKQIDQTLRMIGSSAPRAGIEQRIAARLADASVKKSAGIFGLPRFALASAAGIAACAAIVAGSINHSRHMLPIAPGIQLPVGASSGVGAADAQKLAPRPVAPPAHGRPRSVHRLGTPANTQNPDGMAVPKTPLPQQSAPPSH
jgi:hypothetical protein